MVTADGVADLTIAIRNRSNTGTHSTGLTYMRSPRQNSLAARHEDSMSQSRLAIVSYCRLQCIVRLSALSGDVADPKAVRDTVNTVVGQLGLSGDQTK